MTIGERINIPTTIHDSGTAVVVGREWGPDNNKNRGDGWVYYLSFGYGPAWLVTEEEASKW